MQKSNADFWSLVDKTGDCWLWIGSRNNYGYGRLKIDGKMQGAHRVSFKLHTKQPIPQGALVCHRCDNPPCVRPSHLFLGSDADNNRDKAKKGRSLLGERNPSSKMSEADVRKLKSFKGKESQRAIAKRFNIGQSTVSMIFLNKIWSHVKV